MIRGLWVVARAHVLDHLLQKLQGEGLVRISAPAAEGFGSGLKGREQGEICTVNEGRVASGCTKGR